MGDFFTDPAQDILAMSIGHEATVREALIASRSYVRGALLYDANGKAILSAKRLDAPAAGDALVIGDVNAVETYLGSATAPAKVYGKASGALSSLETVAAYYTAGGGLSMANAANTRINFLTKVYDTHNAVTVGAGWVFTAPLAGIYRVSAAVNMFAAIGTAYDVFMSLMRGGVELLRGPRANGNVVGYVGGSISGDVYLAVGNTIYLTLYQSSGADRNLENGSVQNWCTIHRVPGS